MLLHRLCWFISGFVWALLPASALANSNTFCPSSLGTEIALSAFFDRLETHIFRQDHEPEVAIRLSECQDLSTDVIDWLDLENEGNSFNRGQARKLISRLDFIPFEGYHLNSEVSSHTVYDITPFENNRFIAVHRLPGVQAKSKVGIGMEIPPRKKEAVLALSVKGQHEVYIDGKPIKPMREVGPYFLDNAYYPLPKFDANQRLLIMMKTSKVYRKLAARIVPKQTPFPAIFLEDEKQEDLTAKSRWWQTLWALHHDDDDALQQQESWLKEGLSGPSPWRYALTLLKMNALEVRYPSFHRAPLDDEEFIWWKRYQYELGIRSLEANRLKVARLAFGRLEKDSRSQSAAQLLNAHLLDDLGLSGSAISQLRMLPSTPTMKRLERQFLANAELTHHAGALANSLAKSPSANQNDKHAWLSWLFRSGQFEAFRKTRAAYLSQCPSCWRRFEVFGGLLFPPMPREDLGHFSRVASLEKSVNFEAGAAGKMNSDTSSNVFFQRPLRLSKSDGSNTIRNARLNIEITIGMDGRSELREQRIVVVNNSPQSKMVEFAFEYAPDRQHVTVRRAHLIRNNQAEVLALEIDESTDIPAARLYYDTRRRVLRFSGLKKSDRIEIDWSIVDDAVDPEIPNLYGWVIPLQNRHPTDEMRVSWHSEAPNIFAHLSNDHKPLSKNEIQRLGVRARSEIKPNNLAHITLSNVEKWTDLDDAYIKVIEPRFQTTPYIRAVAEEIVGNSQSQDEKLAKLFRAVQREVHYVGLEMGGHSRTPEWVERVWRRKLGDCKDKAALLIALGNAVGVPLQFVLVRTRRLPKVQYGVPTLALFDHAAVFDPRSNRFLDPNDPVVGNGVLPAAVQGGQAHIVGSPKGFRIVPMGKSEHESIKWHVEKPGGERQSRTVTITLSGHEASDFVHKMGFNSKSSKALRKVTSQILPNWTLLETKYSVSDSHIPSVRVNATFSTPSGGTLRLLSDLFNSQHVWFNQGRDALFRHHDLPRQVELLLPMDKRWHLSSQRVLTYDFGTVTLAQHGKGNDRQLSVKAVLSQPATFLENETRIAFEEVVAILEGHAP